MTPMPDDHDRESREDWVRDFGPDYRADDEADRYERDTRETGPEIGITQGKR